MLSSVFDTEKSWSGISRFFHWFSAIVIIATFILGIWMHNLDPSHEWYRTAPFIHKSIGVLLFFFLLLRIVWRFSNTAPKMLPSHKTYERVAAKIVHILFYVIIFAVILTGYFMVTSRGHPISVFGLFDFPAMITIEPSKVGIIKNAHMLFALSLMFFVIIHALAALKHHFIDKDNTVKRMIKTIE